MYSQATVRDKVLRPCLERCSIGTGVAAAGGRCGWPLRVAATGGRCG